MKLLEKPENWSELKLTEKLLFYKDHLTEEIVPFIDKLQVKPYVVKATDGKCKVANVIRVLKDAEDIHQEDLVPGRIIKSTHGCGWNIFIQEKTRLDLVKQRLQKWNTHYVGNNEPQYAFLKPGFFIEERVSDFQYKTEKKCITFLLRCIKGQPISINVRDFNYEDQNNYLLDGTLIGKPGFPFQLPPETKTMVELAKILSAPFEFVRVDFYLSEKKEIYFSEFTFTPSGGISFYPEEYEIQFGKLWT